MTWFTLILISVITISISNLLQRVMMKDEKSDPFVYGFFFSIFCSVLIFLFAFARGFTMPPIVDLPFNFILMALLYAAALVFVFKALKLIEASQATILSTTSSFWAIVTALLFLGESLSFLNVLGVLLILGAIILVTQKGKQLNLRLNKGSVYVLIAAICYGVAFVNDAYILQRNVDVVSYTAVAFLLPGLVILFSRPTLIKGVKTFLQPALLLKMSLLGLFYSTSAITFYLAYQAGGSVSQLSPISQSRVVLTVILAAIFLNEKDNLPKKLIAATLVSVGVLLLR